jgi:hypothetical protein
MVGGGQGAFIGAVHRIAARMDNDFVLVAGALSSDPARAEASAAELGLDPDRSYASYAEMAKAEAMRPDGIEAVAIVTPNNVHVPAAKAFLEAGIHVICDKPLATTLAEAKKSLPWSRRPAGVRAHPQLHRLSNGAAGARDGGQGRPRRHSHRAVGISAGLVDRGPCRDRPEAGGGAPIRNRRVGGALGDIGTMPITSPASSPGWSSIHCRPISTPSCRAAARRQRHVMLRSPPARLILPRA